MGERERERELQATEAEQTAQKSTLSTPTHRSLRPTLTASVNSLLFTNDIF
jgi:hypothetical protein